MKIHIYNPTIGMLDNEIRRYGWNENVAYMRYSLDYYIKNELANVTKSLIRSTSLDSDLCEYCVHINAQTGAIIPHPFDVESASEDELLKFVAFAYTLIEDDSRENVHRDDRYYIVAADATKKIWNGETVSDSYDVRLFMEKKIRYYDDCDEETRTFTIKGKRFEETKRYKTLLKCIKRLEEIYTDKYYENSVHKIMREARCEYMSWLVEKNRKRVARRDRYKQLAKERFKSEVKNTIKALKYEIYYKQYLKINSSIHSENAADIFYKGSCSHIEDNEVFHEVEKAWDNYYEY